MNPWTALLELLGNILSFFYTLVPNYGIAIIFLTLLIGVVLFPLTLKQTRSMKAMQEIQPQVKKLQKEHKGNREELNKELMALYQERGVNPAAGCLPLLIQMPIWFALFRVLRISVTDGVLSSSSIPVDSDLAAALVAGKSNFLSMDLLISPSSASSGGIVGLIPYLVLIVIVMGAGYYQQAQTTRTRKRQGQAAPEQPAGMQTAFKILPVFFGFISWGFPTGLVLYFAVSSLFRIAQQSVILGMDDEEPTGLARLIHRGPSEPSDDPEPQGEPQKRTGPSQHASRKRKKRRRK